jgi:hypothetical protein
MRNTRASLMTPERSSISAMAALLEFGRIITSSVCWAGPGPSNMDLPNQATTKPPTAARTRQATMKFRNTTNWLRDPLERRGGGRPRSGRSASLADFGTIGRLG